MKTSMDTQYNKADKTIRSIQRTTSGGEETAFSLLGRTPPPQALGSVCAMIRSTESIATQRRSMLFLDSISKASLTFFIKSPFSICLSMSDFYIYLFSWNTKLGLWRNLKAIDAWRFPWRTLFPHLIILNFHHLSDSRMRTNLFCNFKNAKPRSLDIWKEMEIANLSFTEITMSKHSYVSVTLYERCLHKTSHNRGPNIAKNPLI